MPACNTKTSYFFGPPAEQTETGKTSAQKEDGGGFGNAGLWRTAAARGTPLRSAAGKLLEFFGVPGTLHRNL